jgi:hypothetical protein
MMALVVGNDYLAGRFAYLLKKLTVPFQRTPRFFKKLLSGKDSVFFSGKGCIAGDIFDSLRHGCSVFSEQIILEKKADISLVRYAERNRRKLLIGSFDVFNPVIKEIKSLISGEAVSEIFINRVGPKQFGYVKLNIIDDLVIQDIGIINYLLKGETKVINVFSADIYNHCLVHMKKGKTSVLAYANKNVFYKERTMEVFAEKTKINANIINQSLRFMRSEGIEQSLYGTGYESYRERLIKKEEPLKDAMERFIRGKSNPVAYSDIEKTLETVMEIKKAVQPPIFRKNP